MAQLKTSDTFLVVKDNVRYEFELAEESMC